MLQHVPSEAMRNRLLAEVARVLLPGGVFAGTDSLYSRSFRLLHLLDTMVVVDPDTFPERLRKAGFAEAFLAPSRGRCRPSGETRISTVQTTAPLCRACQPPTEKQCRVLSCAPAQVPGFLLPL